MSSTPPSSVAAVVAELQNADEAEAFLKAVLSSEEYENLQGRWKAFQFKRDGLSHREAAKRAGVSVQTATRAAALLKLNEPILEQVLVRCNSRGANLKTT